MTEEKFPMDFRVLGGTILKKSAALGPFDAEDGGVTTTTV
jgi:hypothetical protein